MGGGLCHELQTESPAIGLGRVSARHLEQFVRSSARCAIVHPSVLRQICIVLRTLHITLPIYKGFGGVFCANKQMLALIWLCAVRWWDAIV